MQAFGKSFGQTVCDGLGHDRVVVVVFGPEAVAQLLEADAAGNRESSDIVGKPGLPGGDKVAERPARLVTFPIRLLAEEVKALEHLFACGAGIQLDVIAHSVGGEEAVYAAGYDQVLLDDPVQ